MAEAEGPSECSKPRSRYNLLGLETGAPVETSDCGDYEKE